jgi:hypothetical protein
MKTKYYGEFPSIPNNFPNPDHYERHSRNTVLTEFDPQSYLEAIETWFSSSLDPKGEN